MAELVSTIEAELLGRVERVAAALGTTRARLVERALDHYLSHVAELERAAAGRPVADADAVDWAAAKRALIAARCPSPSCPHAGDCPIELCPLERRSSGSFLPGQSDFRRYREAKRGTGASMMFYRRFIVLGSSA
jgi:predicted transcriptional regulator